MPPKLIIKAIIILVLNLNFIQAYKILIMCPTPVRSHYNLCSAASDVLSKRGHEVTLISAFSSSELNYREIAVDMTRFKEEFPSGLQRERISRSEATKKLKIWLPAMPELIFANKNVQKMINDSSETFDLFILEYYINQNLLGFGVKYDCPSLILTSTRMYDWVAIATNNPLSIATVPHIISKYSSRMNLWQRIGNALSTFSIELSSQILIEPLQKSMYEKYFPEESKRVSYSELTSTISGVLINSHPSIGIPRPLMPNSIEIGGFHIGGPKPLPDDLKFALDSSENGVIYFSLGSVVKSTELSGQLRRSILKVFATLKQTILWKFEDDSDDMLIPDNVIVRKWMPQISILAHPNVQLFISHGGLLSCTEATHFGVPLFMIPLFSDQHHNAQVFVDKGQGLMLQYENVTETSFRWAIIELLSNPMYKEATKNNSRIYHDRAVKPRDLLAFHAEYIVRTQGATYLSSPKLPRYSLLLLDVMALMMIPPGAILIIFIYIYKHYCCKKHSSSVSKKYT